MSEESLLSGQAPAATGVQQDADATKVAEGAGDQKPDADNPQTATDAGNGEGEGKAEGDKAPEDYDLALPEGFELDAEIGGEFKAYAKELKLPQESAQKLAGIAVKLLEKSAAAQQAAFDAQKKAWADEVRADPEIGGAALNQNLGYAAKVFDTFSPELRDLLGSTGFGNHPVFVKAFVRIGKAISEDRLTGGEQRGQPAKSVESVLYPTMNR